MNPAIIAIIVAAVVLPPIMQGAAVVILHNANRALNSPILALLERLRVAQCGFVGSTLISLLAVNSAIGRPVPIAPPWGTVIIAVALLIIAAPAAAFSMLYWSGRFGDEE